MSTPPILQVAVPAPLRQTFDYIAPDHPWPEPGVRVRVPFGRRKLVGVLLKVVENSELPREKLKSAIAVLDQQPLLAKDLLALLRWAADYYHHPIGEVIQAALPARLRQGHPATVAGIEIWKLTAAGRAPPPEAFARAPVQKKIWQALCDARPGLSAAALAEISPRWRAILRGFVSAQWVGVEVGDCLAAPPVGSVPAPVLKPAQAAAVEAVTADLPNFHCFLLHGITGSGKTEVYLRLVEKTLATGRQALILVPEIGLTPQLIKRFQQRFPTPIAVLHSGLSDSERLCAWQAAGTGKAAIVLGTRSAVFAPFSRLGLIVVDEEHDGSYKQQEGFRYHARDLAIWRARREQIPIVLGSATPSLESLNNVRQRRYQLLKLPDRTGGAGLPEVRLLDLRRLAVNDGLSPPLLQALKDRLDKGEQSLLFLNRRGFAPVLLCRGCGWLAPCRRCDARLTLHKRSGRLRCHHCGADHAVPSQCPQCGGNDLRGLGEGTQRVEAALARHFPHARIVRVDRDSIHRKDALADKLRQVHTGEADILVGTQMLSKGHDFPRVTLVGVVNADQGLYGVDFRSGEQLFQQIIQVAGRAGRSDTPGQVLVQTYHSDNPLFTALCRHDYQVFADYALEERRQAEYPPFAHLALLRAESPQAGAALAFLHQARALALPVSSTYVQLMEPAPSPMERRAGRYRAQLLAQSLQRPALHEFLARWLLKLERYKPGKKVRWSLDVDPMVMY